MSFLLVSLLAFTAAVKALPVITAEDNRPINHVEIIEKVNSMKTTWKAAIPIKFANATVADLKRLLGTVLPHEPEYVPPPFEKTKFKYADTDIPDSFDVRTAWTDCAAISSHIRDQSQCGSCWAFAATETFNDRYCITTGDVRTLFSTEDTNSCCTGVVCGNSKGCDGGQTTGAWNFFVNTGVTTGGDFEEIGLGASCKPYSLQSCAHHVEPPDGVIACSTLSLTTPSCTSQCNELSYEIALKQDKHYASSSYSIKTVANIQKELMEKGSITVSMTVYEDFDEYESGIYQHVYGSSLGGHAIKLIGWGTENGVDYWIINNSWNTYWGESGTFRIIRGVNECGIESGAVAGDV